MIVVDASVALKWVLAEADRPKAVALRSQEIAAPSLWQAEAANTLWRYVRLSKLSEAEAATRFDQLVNVPMINIPVERDAARALSLAVALDHPIYDCFYLALAIREGIHFVTADTRFASAVRKQGRWANHIKLLSET